MSEKAEQFVPRTEWHPAFVQAIQREFDENQNVLTFETELPLTDMPLKIDMLVIKKNKNIKIKKNIGQIFRTYNVIEYKSPGDYISIEDYDKTHAYSRFYAAGYGVRTREMSVTLVSTRKPENLLNYLESETRYIIINNQEGIYVIEGDTSPTQIIVSKELPEQANFWLKNLNSNLATEKLNYVIDVAKGLGKNALLGAYLDVIIKANPIAFQELIKMGTDIDKILKEAGYIDRWQAEGQAKMIIQILSRRLKVPSESLQKKIMSIHNITKLDELADFAWTCVSLKEFATALKEKLTYQT